MDVPPDPRQVTIEDYIAQLAADTLPEPPAPGTADILPQLRGLLNEMIRESGRSRAQIAEAMNTLLNCRSITVHQINSWTSDANGRHIPLEYIHAMERACGARLVTEYLCKLHGGRYIDRQANDVLDLGQLQVLKIQLAVRERELKRELAR